jgi:hypothetical protein
MNFRLLDFLIGNIWFKHKYMVWYGMGFILDWCGQSLYNHHFMFYNINNTQRIWDPKLTKSSYTELKSYENSCIHSSLILTTSSRNDQIYLSITESRLPQKITKSSSVRGGSNVIIDTVLSRTGIYAGHLKITCRRVSGSFWVQSGQYDDAKSTAPSKYNFKELRLVLNTNIR